MTYVFLSIEWIDAAREIRLEYSERIPPPQVPMKANVVVTEVPFDENGVRGFIDTTTGSILLEPGELEDAELTVTTDYETARAIFVAQDVAKIMESFMMGKILVVGDMTQLLSLTPPTDPDHLALAGEIVARLERITAG